MCKVAHYLAKSRSVVPGFLRHTSATNRPSLEYRTMRTTSNAARPPTFGIAAVRRYPISGIAVAKFKKLNAGFDPEAFLAKTGVGRTIRELATDECAFSQGEPADAIFYIQKG